MVGIHRWKEKCLHRYALNATKHFDTNTLLMPCACCLPLCLLCLCHLHSAGETTNVRHTECINVKVSLPLPTMSTHRERMGMYLRGWCDTMRCDGIHPVRFSNGTHGHKFILTPPKPNRIGITSAFPTYSESCRLKLKLLWQRWLTQRNHVYKPWRYGGTGRKGK